MIFSKYNPWLDYLFDKFKKNVITIVVDDIVVGVAAAFYARTSHISLKLCHFP